MPRLTAWTVLRSGSETPMREVDAAAERAELEARDRGLLRRIVGTEVRRRGTLRAIASCFARGKPNADLRAHLHVALVQLLFLDRIPDHAVLSEAGEATARTQGRAKVGYVNGVLRAVLRARREGRSGDPRRDLVGRDLHLAEPVFRDPGEHPLLWAEDALSIPAPLYRRWLERLGEVEARRLAEVFLVEPPLSLRVVRGERAALAAELAAPTEAAPSADSPDTPPSPESSEADEPATRAGLATRPGHHPRLLIAPSAGAETLFRSAAFREGRVTVQGGTALAAAELVQAAPGERVLDLCAAPGGKTAVLAEAGAFVVACDVDAARGAALRSTLERLGVSDRVQVRESDGTSAVPETDFDAVLVDAPCTNTGVLGARPGARWRFGPQTRASLAALQARLLREGAAAVRPGGRLVWSTCSLEPEENERLVRDFLDEHSEWRLEAEQAARPGGSGAGATAGAPADSADPADAADPADPIDGGWAARLRRSD